MAIIGNEVPRSEGLACSRGVRAKANDKILELRYQFAFHSDSAVIEKRSLVAQPSSDQFVQLLEVTWSTCSPGSKFWMLQKKSSLLGILANVNPSRKQLHQS